MTEEQTDPFSFAAVLLAAGLGSRYRAAGGAQASKLLAAFEGAPLVRRAALAALGSRARPVIVVTGHAAEPVRAALADLPLTFTHNADYAQGLSTSLRAGVSQIPETCAAAAILLGDMPRVSSELIDALAALLSRRPDADAVIPTFKGARGNPVLLARRLFPRLSSLEGDFGARRLLSEPDVRLFEWAADEAVAVDIDTPEALAWAQRPAPG